MIGNLLLQADATHAAAGSINGGMMKIIALALLSLVGCSKLSAEPFTAERVIELRSGGSQEDGIHTLYGPIKVTADDYFLMGSDNSTAARNHPDIPRDQLTEGRWWTAAPGLRRDDVHTYNAHSTQGKDGVWYLDSFYSDIPYPEYQADPREVVWHAKRVKQLRAEGIPQERRIQILQTEAKSAPWAK